VIRIVPFQRELAPKFAELNLAWIEQLFVVEAPDRAMLEDAENTIVKRGGEIFFALQGDEVIGTSAIVPHTATTFELAKMAVTPAAQRLGVGRRIAASARRRPTPRSEEHTSELQSPQ